MIYHCDCDCCVEQCTAVTWILTHTHTEGLREEVATSVTGPLDHLTTVGDGTSCVRFVRFVQFDRLDGWAFVRLNFWTSGSVTIEGS